MMNRILMLTSSLSNDVDNGGTFGSRNNLRLLRSLENTEVTVLSIVRGINNIHQTDITFIPASKNKWETFAGYFRGYSNYLTPKAESLIFQYLKNMTYTLLFLDGSAFGRIAKRVKNQFPHIKIITFFHNVEIVFALMKIRLAGLQYIPALIADWYNERLSVKYAHKLIAINERDKIKLEKIYKRSIDGILSTIWFDDLDLFDIKDATPLSKPLEVLFLGSWFYANIAGISWFIKNVLSVANIRLTVAGKGMEKLREAYQESEKLCIFGSVRTLEDVYGRTDCVIAPIFDGSGMKVKVGVALRYGRTVVGTPEAFMGYPITNGLEGYICETADDFLKAFDVIAKWQKTKVNRASFEFCKRHLSKSLALEKLQKILF
jgi:hypothetical protein